MIDYCRGYSALIWLIATSTCMSFVQGDIMVFSKKSRSDFEIQFKDAPARFGKPIPLEGIRVMIIINSLNKVYHKIFINIAFQMF